MTKPTVQSRRDGRADARPRDPGPTLVPPARSPEAVEATQQVSRLTGPVSLWLRSQPLPLGTEEVRR